MGSAIGIGLHDSYVYHIICMETILEAKTTLEKYSHQCKW